MLKLFKLNVLAKIHAIKEHLHRDSHIITVVIIGNQMQVRIMYVWLLW